MGEGKILPYSSFHPTTCKLRKLKICCQTQRAFSFSCYSHEPALVFLSLQTLVMNSSLLLKTILPFPLERPQNCHKEEPL